jgi:hypothetical protein
MTDEGTQPGAGLRRWCPGAADLLCVTLAAPLALLHTLLSYDTWWHLTLGAATLRDGRIPAVETFSWTAPGAPLASHAWLFDVALAALERAGGLGLAEVAGALLVAITLRLVYGVSRALGASPTLALAGVVVGAHLSLHHLILRPQLVTYVAFAWLFLAYIEHRAGRSRAVLAAPAVVLLWANLHGGFLLGVAFLGGVALLEALEGRLGDPAAAARARRLALLCALSAAAACVNPLGPRQIIDALANTPAFDPVHSLINEWRPPDLSRVPGLRLVAVLAVVLALLLPARPPLFEACGLLAALTLALGAWRNTPLMAIVGVPVLAAWATRVLAALAPRAQERAPGAAGLLARLDVALGAPGGGPGGWLLLAAAGLLGAALTLAHPPDVLASKPVSALHPVEAARWVSKSALRGRLFNSYMWGGYLGWALPEHPVAIDSRMLPFREFFLEDYHSINAATSAWREAIDRHRVEWVLLEREGRLPPVLHADPGWRLVYADDVAEVFVREGGENGHLPAR